MMAVSLHPDRITYCVSVEARVMHRKIVTQVWNPAYTTQYFKIYLNMSTEIEREANTFAMLLLIPNDIFRIDMSNEVDLFSDKIIDELCNKYQVTQGVMLARIKIYYRDCVINKK